MNKQVFVRCVGNAACFALVLLVPLLMSACGRSEAPGREARPQAVRSAALERGDIPRDLEFTGDVVAPERAQIAASVGGRIETIRVRLGDSVAKGDLLAEIDAEVLTAQRREAEAGVRAAEAARLRARTDFENTETEERRVRALAEKNLVSEQEQDNIRARLKNAEAALVSADAQLEQAKARVATLAAQIAQTRVRAPFDAMIEARFLDPGSVVAAGTPILALTRTRPATVRFSVPERFVAAVNRSLNSGDTSVQLRVDAYPMDSFPGKVARISPVLESSSRSRMVEVDFPNEDNRLLPGMFGRVHLRLGVAENALLLPLVALLDFSPVRAGAPDAEGSGTGTLYTVREGKAQRATVRLGIRAGDMGEVLEGLAPGDRVVIEGQHLLRDGIAVADQSQRAGAGGAPGDGTPVQGRED